MRIVLLTTRLEFRGVLAMCRKLREVNLSVAEIVCARHPVDSILRHWAANSVFVCAIARRLRTRQPIEVDTRVLRELRKSGIAWRFFIQPFNSTRVVAHLKAIQPDFLVNLGGPIYRRALIETARIGLLNWHMALLPEFRGMNVAEWSVLHGYPTGATVHFIDPGIDTGNILAFFPVSTHDCPGIGALREKFFARQCGHIASAVRLLVDGKIAPTHQEAGAGKQYYAMHRTLKDKVEQILRKGYEPSVHVPRRAYMYHHLPGN